MFNARDTSNLLCKHSYIVTEAALSPRGFQLYQQYYNKKLYAQIL